MPSAVPSLHRLAGFGRRLARDTRGAILLFSAILLIFVLGTGGLILDFARVWNAQSELQSFADHAALVAAGELDGNAGAIARANDALERLATDRQHYANERVALDSTNLTPRFLSNLPADDRDNNLAPFVTNDDAQARFVHVQLDPYTVSTIFADILLTISGNARVDIGIGATAVAGYTQFVCDITPLMFCTPGPNYEPVPGRMIHLKSQSSWGPGAFGLLQVEDDPSGLCSGGGANYLRCVLGVIQNRSACFERNRGVVVETGQNTGPAASGLNVRFDRYDTSVQSERNNPAYAPAPNVVRQQIPPPNNACGNNNNDASTGANPSMGLPRDACFGNGETCGGSRFGDGNWDQLGYQATNHNNTFLNGLSNGATRYQMYLAEITAAGAASNPILPQPRSQTGRPACSNSAPSDPDRRLLIAAAIDCNANEPRPNTPLPVQAYVQLFMTEPAPFASGGGGNTSIWLEEVGRVDLPGAGASGVIRDVIQLYR